jgi:hypothetical protein
MSYIIGSIQYVSSDTDLYKNNSFVFILVFLIIRVWVRDLLVHDANKSV